MLHSWKIHESPLFSSSVLQLSTIWVKKKKKSKYWLAFIFYKYTHTNKCICYLIAITYHDTGIKIQYCDIVSRVI